MSDNEELYLQLVEDRAALLKNISYIFERAIESNDIFGIKKLIDYVNSTVGCTLTQFLFQQLLLIEQNNLNENYNFYLSEDEIFLLGDLLPKIKSLDEKIFKLYYE